MTEVVARRVREVRHRGIERDEIHRVLQSWVASLGLEPLAQVELQHVDAVERVGAVQE